MLNTAIENALSAAALARDFDALQLVISARAALRSGCPDTAAAYLGRARVRLGI